MSDRGCRAAIGFAIGACLGVSWVLLPAHGTGDVDRYWLPWIELTASDGVLRAYRQSASDYPPLAFVILSYVGSATAFFEVAPHAGLKLCLWLFLAASALTFYWTTGRAALAAALYGSLILSSVWLAYLDVFFVPPLILSLWALHQGRVATGLLLYGVSCLIKFQPLIIAPALLLYVYRSRQMRATALAPALMLAGLTLLVFGGDVVNALGRAGDHRYLSGQALNFNWILTFATSVLWLQRGMFDVILISPSAQALFGLRVLFACVYGYILYAMPLKTFPDLLRAANLAYLAYFTFSPGVHENHLVVLIVTSAFLAALNGKVREFAMVAVFLNLNLLVFYGVDGHGPSGRILVLVHLGLAVAATVVTSHMLVTAGRSQLARTGARPWV